MPEPVNRRTFIRRSSLAALGAGAAVTFPSWAAALTLPTEEGSVSGSVSMPDGFRVPAGKVLTFDPNVSTTVRVGANVVVEGTLRMKPASPQVVHRLVFEGIDEARFVGGGMDVLESDIGLWVIGSGVLDIAGSPKVAWNRTGIDPTWLPTDELRVTPTDRGDFGSGGFPLLIPGDPVPRVENPFGYAGSAADLTFVDTAGSPHVDDIEAIAAAGVTKGCGGGKFCPDEFVTRGQMAVFLGRALGLGAAASAGFVDTVGHPFEAQIDALAAAGVTKGCGGGKFCPDEFVTREQMATFLARAFGLLPPAPVETDFRAEVLNLTRNVSIEGTAAGRAHILIRSSRPQTVKHLEIRHMGPRQSKDGHTAGVLGRYGLHFHHCGDGSRGSVIEGVVVSHTGNHAFVPHESHGVSFTDCISYDTFDEAYWWDEEDSTHDVSWIGCVAAHVRVDPDFRGFRLTGFLLGRGQNVSAVGCVAVGVLGNEESSGFRWPELPNGTEGVWDFRNCVAHNNSRNGIFTWQNTSQPGHVIDGFTAYRNGFAGIDHGAYENKYRYQRTTLFENNLGVLCHADSKAAAGPDDGLVFADINIIALDVGIELTGTNGTPAHPVLFRDMTIQAPTPLRIEADKGEGARIDRFERCGLEPEEVDFVAARSGSEFTFVRADGSSWTLDSNGTTSS